MTEYLTIPGHDNAVVRTSDWVTILNNAEWAEAWQDYQRWLAAGNHPEVSQNPPTVPEFETRR